MVEPHLTAALERIQRACQDGDMSDALRYARMLDQSLATTSISDVRMLREAVQRLIQDATLARDEIGGRLARSGTARRAVQSYAEQINAQAS